MSGCYGDLPTSASTEKYRMVKERRGEGWPGVGPGMKNVIRAAQALKSNLELGGKTTVATADRNIIMVYRNKVGKRSDGTSPARLIWSANSPL